MTKRRALSIALLTAALAWGSLAAVFGFGLEPVLGLDLEGGFSVRLTAPESTDSDVLDKAVDIMRRRIEALGSVQEPEISVAGDRSVLVQLPGVTDRERALAAVGSTGDLSFRQVVNIGALPGLSPIFGELGVTPPGLVPDEGTTDTTAAPDETTTTTIAQPTPADVFPAGIDLDTGLTLVDDPGGEAYLIEPDSGLVYHVLPALLTGADISGANAEFGGGGFGAGGGWVVDPSFTSTGGDKFQEATAQLAGFPIGDVRRRFAIVLDGQVVSAPQVADGTDPIDGLDPGNVVITIGSGENQQAQAEDLATVLRYGALPTTFVTERVEAVSATLGSDSLRAGLIAGFGGLFLVGLAMLFYYRALGLIAVIGLTVFGSILVVLFAVLGETQGVTLTLAGVAGIVVSIGITSDSYIVYFERVKEEVRHGRSLRAAVDNAFKRAFRTILTADAVSLFGAVLLFVLAVGQVKGFATALGLATLTDVAVAYFFTRPATAWLVRTRMGDGGAATIRGAAGHTAEART